MIKIYNISTEHYELKNILIMGKVFLSDRFKMSISVKLDIAFFFYSNFIVLQYNFYY